MWVTLFKLLENDSILAVWTISLTTVLIWDLNNWWQQLMTMVLGTISVIIIITIANLGRKISSESGDDREGSFLQRVSVLVQRYNTVWYMTPCQPLTARTDDLYTHLHIVLILKLPRVHIYRGQKNNNNSTLQSTNINTTKVQNANASKLLHSLSELWEDMQ